MRRWGEWFWQAWGYQFHRNSLHRINKPTDYRRIYRFHRDLPRRGLTRWKPIPALCSPIYKPITMKPFLFLYIPYICCILDILLISPSSLLPSSSLGNYWYLLHHFTCLKAYPIFSIFLRRIVRSDCSIVSIHYFHIVFCLRKILGRFYRTRGGPGTDFPPVVFPVASVPDDRRDEPGEPLILPTGPGDFDVPCAVTSFPLLDISILFKFYALSRVIAVFVIRRWSFIFS